MLRTLLTRLLELLVAPRGAARRQRLVTPVAQARDRRLLRLAGRVRADASTHLLTSPLSERPCVYYRVQVEAHRDGRWQTILDEAQLCAHFRLEDETGSALIDAGQGRTTLGDDLFAAAPDFDGRPSPRVTALLRARPARAEALPRRYRYRELCLELGQPLSVLGLCRHEPDPDPRSAASYRRSGLRVRLVAPWFGALRIAAAPRREGLGVPSKLC